MEKNCLYKKLNGSVNIDNPLKIGEIPVHVKVTSGGNTREVTWNSEQAGYIRVLNGSNKICLANDSVYTDYITIAAGSTGRTVKFDAGEYNIAVGNYYNIRTLNLFGYTDMVFSIDLGDKVEYISSVRGFSLLNNDIVLDINKINPNVSEFNELDVRNTNIDGSLEMFIEKIVAGGRNSGKTNIQIGGTNITFKNISAKDWNKSSFVPYYSESGCTVRDSIDGPTSGTLLATYTKSTGTWKYEI